MVEELLESLKKIEYIQVANPDFHESIGSN